MGKVIDNVMLTVLPVASATISAASVFYVMTLIEFPEAKLFAAIIFVLSLYKSWGDSSLDNI